MNAGMSQHPPSTIFPNYVPLYPISAANMVQSESWAKNEMIVNYPDILEQIWSSGRRHCPVKMFWGRRQMQP